MLKQTYSVLLKICNVGVIYHNHGQTGASCFPGGETYVSHSSMTWPSNWLTPWFNGPGYYQSNMVLLQHHILKQLLSPALNFTMRTSQTPLQSSTGCTVNVHIGSILEQLMLLGVLDISNHLSHPSNAQYICEQQVQCVKCRECLIRGTRIS